MVARAVVSFACLWRVLFCLGRSFSAWITLTIAAAYCTLQGPLGIHKAQENPAVHEAELHLRNIQVAL